jgi:hypothetical protein
VPARALYERAGSEGEPFVLYAFPLVPSAPADAPAGERVVDADDAARRSS